MRLDKVGLVCANFGLDADVFASICVERNRGTILGLTVKLKVRHVGLGDCELIDQFVLK